MSTFVLPLADPSATLETVGGKGMSLAKMARARLPVPGGFHVTTEAYRRFVALNGIQEKILDALQQIDLADLPRLEAVSRQIGACFTEGVIPAEIAEEIAAAYRQLAEHGDVPVAVRSSATAEDLPGASFAGQQETYLNICGAEVVLAAVRQCWASLWTARAIAYRARQNIAPNAVALAVVVQELVFADAAGVLFTANPVSGRRDELMITAAWGLGEAIVGGLVTPDTLIVDKNHGKVTRRETSEKLVMTVRAEAGTRERPVPKNLQKAAVLTDAQADQLAGLGVEIEQLYGTPMDIEWTLAGGRFAVVQARPITSLGEAPQAEPPWKWERTNSKGVMMRGSFAEFVPDPVSPLFSTLAVPIAEAATRDMLGSFFGVNDKAASSYLYEVINGYVYVGMVMSAEVLWKMTILSIFRMKSVVETSRPRWAVVRTQSHALAEKWAASPAGPADLAALPAPELLAGARELFRAAADYYAVAQSGPIGVTLISEIMFSAFYRALVRRKTDPDASLFLLGLETISLHAEKSLYDLAMWVKGQPEAVEYLRQTAPEQILAALAADPVLPPLGGEFARRWHAHLAAFGHTLYDLDFARPVPADDPTPVLAGLKAYLNGEAASPYERQRAQVERREQAARDITARLGWPRRNWFTRLLRWAQDTGPDREDCIADMGLGYPQLRALLRELGRRLAEKGAIAQVDDIYWLEAREADTLAAALETGEALPNLAGEVEHRKAFWQRARGITPPVSVPEKTLFSKLLPQNNPEGSTLKGYGASAGKVTARACVLRGPDDFDRMRPGDVIVAVTTTPAWTPLFVMASAVVTDIGGPLSHSSIVAREYGIPAVMATGSASKRIKHGQMITVDGSAGMVTLRGE